MTAWAIGVVALAVTLLTLQQLGESVARPQQCRRTRTTATLAEIINHCVWLYFRFPLSFRDVEELVLVRGVMVSYETIRRWCAKFGQTYSQASCAHAGHSSATSGISMRSSSVSTVPCIICGVRSTSTATCSMCWFSHAETRWRPRSSSGGCSSVWGMCRG